MKKLLLFLICACLISTLFGFACFADAETPETVTDEVVPPETDEVEPGETEPDIFSRLYEFFVENKEMILTTVSSVVLLVFNALTRNKANKISLDQENTIGGVNQLIEAYETLLKAFENIKGNIADIRGEVATALNNIAKIVEDLKETDSTLADDLNKASTVIEGMLEQEMLQNNALMDVLSSVYANSTLPRSVKELVVLKRNENIRINETAQNIVHPKVTEGGANDV